MFIIKTWNLTKNKINYSLKLKQTTSDNPSQNFSLTFIIKTRSFTKIRLRQIVKLKMTASQTPSPPVRVKAGGFIKKRFLSQPKSKNRLYHSLFYCHLRKNLETLLKTDPHSLKLKACSVTVSVADSFTTIYRNTMKLY